ncbi:ras-related protein 2 [Cutaneotrichosporon oleaginosum]|uniref:Ras-related protein 2 n=1 Tax=Cutaneotrichosporon oleaginosum TaxID=879819 RepID=A0A0J0XY75_9TREE|nr:ras-related protein 2 [Cutaneotrichosporon oleaginosum]KLT46000.1 ras-related protein 2 [Cutaneotrichosporon oleaginosum]
MRRFRVAIMGSGGVGKSAIVLRFMNGEFLDMYDPTIEDSYRKQFDVDGQPCVLDILDTAGTDQYLTFNDLFIRDSHGLVLVFSLTQRDTLEDLYRVRQDIERLKASEGQHVPMVIVGNKTDLELYHDVRGVEGMKLAADAGCEYIETSARHNTNIDDVFAAVVRQIRIHPLLERRPYRHRRRPKCVIL